MTSISLRLDNVRNLANLLSRTDTRPLKHTERLALVASAFGMRADAFMHALKGRAAGETSSPRRRNLAVAGSNSPTQLESLGISAVGAWKDVLDIDSGLVLIVGSCGSGRTATLRASMRHISESGREVATGFFRDDAAAVSVIDDIDDSPCLLRRAREIVGGGGLVVGAVHGSSAGAALERLSTLGYADAFKHARGVLTQMLACPYPSATSNRRVMISHVDTWFAEEDEACTLIGLMQDAVRKMDEGLIEPREIARLFGTAVNLDLRECVRLTTRSD